MSAVRHMSRAFTPEEIAELNQRSIRAARFKGGTATSPVENFRQWMERYDQEKIAIQRIGNAVWTHG